MAVPAEGAPHAHGGSLIQPLSADHVNDNFTYVGLRPDVGVFAPPVQEEPAPSSPKSETTDWPGRSRADLWYDRITRAAFRLAGAAVLALGAVSGHALASDPDSKHGTTYEYPFSDYPGTGSGAAEKRPAASPTAGAESDFALEILPSQQEIIDAIGLEADQKAFLTKMILAAEELKHHGKAEGINLEVMVGQAIQESGWGGSLLSNKYNNPFGMKYWGTGKATPRFRTPEQDRNGKTYYTDVQFRAFDTLEEGFEAYAQLLRSGYPAAIGHPDDPLAVLQALQANPNHSWATDKKYAENVLACVNRARLPEIFAVAAM